MANEPRKPFQSPAPLPLPTPPGGTQPKAADKSMPAMPLWTSGAADKLGGMPLFRGAGQKPNSLMGRLKGLKTKDVAFIGAGLAVLVMAPLAEYLISEGEEPNTLQQGFAQNGMPFPNGSDPAEVGILGLAQGGIPGEATDVITPLNARDPSTLIVGGGMGEQKEPPAAAAAEPKRDAPKDSVWDKVVSSAKTGASSAARKVSLPKPGGKLAGALNGLRSLSGGSTGASLKLAAPDSKGLFSAPRNSTHLAASQAVPGYRGAGPRVIAGGSGGNTAGRGGSPFGGSGGGAAGDVMSGGISGGGRGSGFSGGDGDPTKNPGGNSTKDNKTLGESLAFLRQKMEMEKAIDLKWAKKRYDELERKKMIEQTLVQTAQQAFMKVLDKLLEGKKDGGGGSGGGSGGGGSPPGGDPAGKKPESGAPAALPGGVTPVGTIGSVAQFERATEQKTEADKLAKDSGTRVERLNANSDSLEAMAKQADGMGNDTIGPKLAKALRDAKTSVVKAQGDLQKANEAAVKPLGPLGKALDVYKTDVPKLQELTKSEADTVGAAEKLLGGLQPDGDKYGTPKESGGDLNAAMQGLKEVTHSPPTLPQADQTADQAAQKAYEAAQAAIKASMGEVNLAYGTIAKHQANADALKQRFIDALTAADRSVGEASGNVRTANAGVGEAIKRAGELQTAFNTGLEKANGAVAPTKSAGEDADKAYSTWSNLVGTEIEKDKSGVTKKESATTTVGTAKGKVTEARTAYDAVKKKH